MFSRKEYNNQWQRENRDKCRGYAKKYRKAHRDHILERERTYLARPETIEKMKSWASLKKGAEYQRSFRAREKAKGTE